MQTSPEPQPLTRLNVTKHDRIWDKESPKGFFGFDNSNALFSPPLKHITPETTQELWEKFDPLDLLVDSASEKSIKSESSSDTMIMMTTEEENRNKERIKNSFMEYEQQKSGKNPHMKQTTHNYPTDGFIDQHCDYTNNNGHKNPDEDFLNDEGYGTDSRTNTTASLSSPLSSSLSSLLTSESSSSQGSMQKNLNVNARSQQIPSNGRIVVGTRQNIIAKKKSQPVEKQDNSLMEKLRALTTIQEEESTGGPESTNQQVPYSSDPRKVPDHRSNDYVHEHRFRESQRSYVNDQNTFVKEPGSFAVEGTRYDLRNPELRFNGDPGRTEQTGYKQKHTNDAERKMFMEESSWSAQEGIFRAVPVKIGQGSTNSNRRRSDGIDTHRHSVSQMENIPISGTDAFRRSEADTREQDSRNCNGDVSNLASRPRPHLHGDSVNYGPSGDIPPANLTKYPNHMYSMPNLAHDIRSAPHTGQVVMRRPKNSSHQNTRKPDFRYSWDCSDVHLMHSKFEVDSRNLTNNNTVQIDETPKLSNQFRATSEMALQNGRALFAPSSDIYKLFQGQGRTGFSQGKQASHRHSFHAMPSQTNLSLQATDPSMEEVRHRLRAASSNRCGSPSQVKNGPVRASHEIYKYNNTDGHPPHMTNHQVRPNSLTEANDKLSTLV
ncbi:uncharacterized protein LOC124279704 [Haliotis rubra]|uniref:uncharacterized protein LOC124279704 n=1 Tax=Haliotis rubra TaxID=36100 RepID=UPI001EE62843|nr:uncharacterized protein LOC124279704 [Haliotis rubra]XP_046571498.1 uncharacterized protein LOC124279704 [Haliotis rubra]XP_046571499.1 uncharacterized protein LOC124279704 [Haliotis rubra]XP_046571500.1 uncharacterized protein LOC124279704 [Haliotis rubra]